MKVSPRFGTTWAIDANTVHPRRLRPVLRALAVHAAEPRHDRLHAFDRDGAVGGGERRAAGVTRQPVPGRTDCAERQLARHPDRRRRQHRLHRSEQGRAEGSPVRRRRPAPAARRRGGVGRLHRIDRTSTSATAGSRTRGIEINQIDPANLPKDANGRWDAAALRRSVPNPFFGVPGTGELGHQRHDPRRPVAAAVPAVQQRDEVSDDRRRKAAVSRHGRQAGQAIDALGRTLQLRVQPDDGQPVGPVQHLRQRAAGHRKRRHRRRSAELLRSRRRILDQHHRYAAPHRARPRRPHSRARQPARRRGSSAAGRRRRSSSSSAVRRSPRM